MSNGFGSLQGSSRKPRPQPSLNDAEAERAEAIFRRLRKIDLGTFHMCPSFAIKNISSKIGGNMSRKFIDSSSGQAVKAGISFGSALAMVISWSANKSILWAIVHGLISWIYVIYYAVTK